MKLFFTITFVILIIKVNAQYLNVTISPGKGQIGELYTYTLTYRSPIIATIKFPNSEKLKQAIHSNHKITLFDVDIRYQDSIYTLNNQFIWQRNFEITPWDTGLFIIKDLTYNFDQVTSHIPPIFFNVGTNSVPSDHPSSIKEFFLVPPLKKENYWSTIVAVGAFIFIIIYWRYSKTKRLKATDFPEKEFNLNAFDKARIQLTYLRLTEYWLDDKIEEHYQQLSQTIKDYLSDILLSNSQELTSEEIAILFTEHDLPSEIEQRFLAILKETDKVKFANIYPSATESKKILQDSEELLMEMNKIINQKQIG